MTTEVLAWGTVVAVRAECVRIIGDPDGGRFTFRQAVATDGGRFERHDFEPGAAWPGGAISREWEQAGAAFMVSPYANGAVMARVRRIEYAAPETGIVIGTTTRREGTLVAVNGRTDNQLLPPIRSVPLYEVSLRSTSRARLVLVHRNDLQAFATQV